MEYFPSLSVLASDLAPWSLTAWTPISAQGLPVTSMICPLIEPLFCAAARGAPTQNSAAIKTRANAHDIIFSDAGFVGVIANCFMLYSPVDRFTVTLSFVTGSPGPAYPGLLHPIISNLGRIPSQRCAATPCR